MFTQSTKILGRLTLYVAVIPRNLQGFQQGQSTLFTGLFLRVTFAAQSPFIQAYREHLCHPIFSD